MLQPTPSPGRGAHIEHHHYQGIGTQRMSAVKSQFTLRQSDGSRPRAQGLANNLPQLDNRDLVLCRILSSRPPFGPYGCLPARSLNVLQAAKNVYFFCAHPLNCSAYLFIYDHLLITFLSRKYTRKRMSSFLLQWLSRGAARESDVNVCIALFSSATDARERFPCQEHWPA